MSVKAATKEEFDTFVTMCTEKGDWNEVYKTDKVTEWMKEGSNDTLILRIISTDFEGISCETVYDTLLDPEYRKTWDDRLILRDTFETIDESNSLIYYQVKVPVVSNRDYVFRQSTRKIGDNYAIYNFSVNHSKYPPNDKFVRATFSVSGYYIQPTENGCSVICIANNNLGGSIPSWLINKQAKNVLPKNMEGIKKSAAGYEKWKAEHNPENKPWRTTVEPTE